MKPFYKEEVQKNGRENTLIHIFSFCKSALSFELYRKTTNFVSHSFVTIEALLAGNCPIEVNIKGKNNVVIFYTTFV